MLTSTLCILVQQWKYNQRKNRTQKIDWSFNFIEDENPTVNLVFDLTVMTTQFLNVYKVMCNN